MGQFAILNSVKTNHKVIAVCRVDWNDVWGNADDGWEVNDISRSDRNREFVADLEIHNVPAFPGAKDGFREFPNTPGITTEVLCTFHISDETIRRELGIKGKIEVSGDDTMYTIDLAKDGFPLCTLYIEGWKELPAPQTKAA